MDEWFLNIEKIKKKNKAMSKVNAIVIELFCDCQKFIQKSA